MANTLTDYRRNIRVFITNSVFNWLQPYIGVWVLIWTQYLDFTQIATIYAIGLFISTLLELPTGALADMIGRKSTIIIGRILNIAAYIMFIFAHDFWTFLIAQILYQANWAFESGAQSALLYDSLKENGKAEKLYKKIEADTFFYCTIFMGAINALGGYFYNIRPNLPYIIGLFTAIISFIITLFFQEPKLDTVKFSFTAYLKQNFDGAKHIFRHPTIKAISLYSFVISFITYSGLWYLYEPRLAEAAFSPQALSLLVAGTYMIRALGTKLIPVLDRYVSPKNIPAALILIQAAGSFLSFLPGRTFAIATVYSRKFLDGFRLPILNNLQNRYIDSRYRATSLSAINLGTNLLLAAAGPAIGYGMQHYGVGNTLGFFAFIGLFVGLPTALSLKKLS